jgi:hypothetical protein
MPPRARPWAGEMGLPAVTNLSPPEKYEKNQGGHCPSIGKCGSRALTPGGDDECTPAPERPPRRVERRPEVLE